MAGLIPKRPGGAGADARFMQWVWDELTSRQVNPTPGGQTNRTTKGFYSIVRPGGNGAVADQTYVVVSVQADYLTVHSCEADGSNEGNTAIYVAKEWRLRESLTSLGGYTFEYADGANALNRKRKKYPTGNAADYEWEVVTPTWEAGEIITPRRARTSVSDPNGSKIGLLLSDARAWSEGYTAP